MPDLVHGLFSAGSLVERVGTIEHQACDIAYILICMHHAGRNDYRHGLVGADNIRLTSTVRRRRWTVVPKVKLEVRWTQKAKKVCLVCMFMGPAGNARLSRREVAHDREKLARNLIVAKEFAEPAAGIVVLS
jgi:hypothetical protein